MGQVVAASSSAAQLIPAITIPPVSSHAYLHHTTLQPRPKLVLIGDSITEQGSSHAQGWVASLAIRYNRRLDVINRGLNGYNSQWGLAALPLILEDILGPSVSIEETDEYGECAVKEGDINSEITECIKPKSSTEDIQEYPQYTFLICFGANDSALSDGAHSRHHIPLQEYASNLKQMINMIQSWNKSKKIAVALLTPPPCDTEVQKKSRDNEHVTRLYVEACKQLANEMNLPVVDLWNGMQLPIKNRGEEVEESSFKSNQQWKADYLSDGLHLTALGNYRLHELVVEMLDSRVRLDITTLPRSFPDHSMIDKNNPQKTFTR